MKQLRHLDLQHCQLNNNGTYSGTSMVCLAAIRQLKQLTELRFQGNGVVNKARVELLTVLSELQELGYDTEKPKTSRFENASHWRFGVHRHHAYYEDDDEEDHWLRLSLSPCQPSGGPPLALAGCFQSKLPHCTPWLPQHRLESDSTLRWATPHGQRFNRLAEVGDRPSACKFDNMHCIAGPAFWKHTLDTLAVGIALKYGCTFTYA
jgi:hypothetical protein